MFQLQKLLTAFFLILFIPTALTASPKSPVLWSSVGPGGGGWLPAITVVDDDDSTVYVACDVGGIYKSSDLGQTWQIKNKGLADYYVQDIAYNPNNPSVLYAATRGGVYKSINGGDSWVVKRFGSLAVNPYNFSAPVSDIEVDPDHPNIVYAGIGVPREGYDLNSFHWKTSDTKGAIYKSIDHGESWTLISSEINTSAMIYSLAIDPNNTDVIYASTSSGVYKSVNAGANWELKSSGLPASPTMTLVINPKAGQSNILYVTVWVQPGSATWQGGVYKSVDGGDNWSAKNTGIIYQVDPKEVGKTTNFPTMIIDKENPQILYIGNTAWVTNPGIYKTINGGDTWVWISNDDPEEGATNVTSEWITEHGMFVKSLAIDPNNSNRVYFGTATHIIKTENAGATWDQSYSELQSNGYWKGNGLETTVVAKITVDPKNSKNVYAGYWDMGFLKSIDGGVSFKRKFDKRMAYPSNVFDIIVDPADSSIIYTATGWWENNKGKVSKSTNFGETWVDLDTGILDAQIWSIALDKNSPANLRTLYATSYKNGIYKSTNSGQNWALINNGLAVGVNLQMRKIYIDPNNSNILYAGVEAKHTEVNKVNDTEQGGLYKSIDKGATWSRIDTGLPQLSVWDIAIPVGHSNIIYTAVSSEYDHKLKQEFPGGVYKSTDGGSTWARMNNGFGSEENLNVSSIEISPVDNNILYAVTTDSPFHDLSSGRGVFKSIDAGVSWQSIGSETHILDYETISIDPSNPSILFAGSSGNGIIKGIDLDVKYNKQQVVTRGEMAKAFLQALNIQPSSIANGTAYDDVAANHPNANWIEKYKAEGFATECQANRFCPNEVVNKEYLARAFLKVLHGAGYTPVPSANGFNDVASNNINIDWITALRDQGFTEGCAVDKYCPEKVVTHEWLNSLLVQLKQSL